MLTALAQLDDPQLSSKVAAQQTRATATAKMQVDAYCTQVLEQPNVSLSKVPDLAAHQATAKENARAWTATIAPQLIQTNTDLLDFSHQFDSFYTPLVKLATNIDQGNNRAQFVQGLQLLTGRIDQKRANSQTALNSLTGFREKVVTDHGNFAGDLTKAQAVYGGDKGEIAQLQSENDALQTAMSRDMAMIGFGATGIVVGGLIIACGLLLEIPTAGASTAIVAAGIVVAAGGTAAMTFGAVDYSKKLASYKANLITIANDQAEMSALSGVSSQLTSLMAANEQATGALQAMVNTWQTLGTQFNGVIDQLQHGVNPDDGPWLLAELATAKTDWDDVAKTAVLINQQCSNVPVVNQPPAVALTTDDGVVPLAVAA